MAKGYRANQEHRDAVQQFGKEISKRAGFACEWCGGKEELRLWEYQPDREPAEENLALLCRPCREMAGGRTGGEHELRSIRNALWSTIPAVAAGAAAVLVDNRVSWAREAIDESLIDEQTRAALLTRIR